MKTLFLHVRSRRSHDRADHRLAGPMAEAGNRDHRGVVNRDWCCGRDRSTFAAIRGARPGGVHRDSPHPRAVSRSGLEFQLGADILSTAVAPSWEQIGKLGAIAVIRTGLNFFLSMEMQSERRSPKTKSGAA